MQAREGQQLPYAEKLLHQTDKSSHQMCSIEKLSLNILQYSQENTCVGECLSNKVAGKRRSAVVIYWKVTSSNWQKQPPNALYRKAVLKQFPIFAGKHLCWKSLSTKVVGKRMSAVVICWTVTLSNWHKQPPNVLYEEAVLKIFTKFTGKHLGNTQVWNFIKKRLQHRCFPINLPKF